MKFTLGEIQAMQEPLKELVAEKMPLRTAFRLNKLFKQIEDQLSFVEKSRVDLVKRLGTDDGAGGYAVQPDKFEEFRTEFGELLSEEVELDFDGVSIDDLGDIKLSIAATRFLEKLFSE